MHDRALLQPRTFTALPSPTLPFPLFVFLGWIDAAASETTDKLLRQQTAADSFSENSILHLWLAASRTPPSLSDSVCWFIRLDLTFHPVLQSKFPCEQANESASHQRDSLSLCCKAARSLARWLPPYRNFPHQPHCSRSEMSLA